MTAGERHFDLRWKAGPDPDRFGYRIYRSTAGERFVPVGIQRGDRNRYVDFVGAPPRRAAYRMTAVDLAGNESLPAVSGEARTRRFSDEELLELAGGRKHVMSYLADFLFPPRRAAAPVRMFSGGERNRLLLARLFARPANVLVLDEPTNDLDIESLELLEAALQDYDGTLLLVSHDRTFLDNVVSQTIAAEGGGVWKEYVGGYADWLRQRAAPAEAEAPAEKPAPARERSRAKLSYKETRELEALPGEIEALEAEQQALAAKMHAPEYYKQPLDVLRADQKRLEEIEALLHAKLERWTALEARASP